MSTAREILRQADNLRRESEHMLEVVKLSDPGVRLGVKIGTFTVSQEAVRVMRAALQEKAAELAAEAEAVEATVTVTR